jgi:hypothetical protein
MLTLAFCVQAEAADALYFACSGTLTIASESKARDEPWSFSLAIDSDRHAVTIDDISIPIITDASEPIIGFLDGRTSTHHWMGFGEALIPSRER